MLKNRNFITKTSIFQELRFYINRCILVNFWTRLAQFTILELSKYLLWVSKHKKAWSYVLKTTCTKELSTFFIRLLLTSKRIQLLCNCIQRAIENDTIGITTEYIGVSAYKLSRSSGGGWWFPLLLFFGWLKRRVGGQPTLLAEVNWRLTGRNSDLTSSSLVS